jgi:predicted component of type VI protein secretion system
MHLSIRHGNTLDLTVPLDGAELSIGRSDWNEVSIPDPTNTVSRAHARLSYENGGYVLADLNSTNGVIVDGLRVSAVRLEPRAPVSIGLYTLTLESEGDIEPDVIDPTDISLAPLSLRPTWQTRVTHAIAMLEKRRAPLVAAGLATVLATGLALMPASHRRPKQPGPNQTISREERQSEGQPVTALKQRAPEPGSGSPTARDDNHIPPVSTGTPVVRATQPASSLISGSVHSNGSGRTRGRNREAAGPDLSEQYHQARAAVEAGSTAQAVALLTKLELDRPGYRDAPELLERALSAERAAAEAGIEAARQLEAHGKLIEARQRLAAIGEAHPSAARVLEEPLATSLHHARVLDAFERNAEAVALYERAYLYLPEEASVRTGILRRIREIKPLQ